MDDVTYGGGGDGQDVAPICVEEEKGSFLWGVFYVFMRGLCGDVLRLGMLGHRGVELLMVFAKFRTKAGSLMVTQTVRVGGGDMGSCRGSREHCVGKMF